MENIVFEKGKKYLIIYDDKGDRVKKKEGKVISKEQNLLKLDSGEVLNMHNIVRAEELK